MVCFAYFVVFRVMGKDYDAAVITAGLTLLAPFSPLLDVTSDTAIIHRALTDDARYLPVSLCQPTSFLVCLHGLALAVV